MKAAGNAPGLTTDVRARIEAWVDARLEPIRLDGQDIHCRFGRPAAQTRYSFSRAGGAAYASSRPAISDIRRASISGSRSENGRKPNRS